MDKEMKSREKVTCSKNPSDDKVLIILSYRMINTQWNQTVIFAFDIMKNKNFFRHFETLNEHSKMFEVHRDLLNK